jgi:hypothetical protein
MFENFLKARANAQRLKAIEDVASRVGRGVHKRIDENRELLELLQSKCPEFMDKHHWVQGWLLSHDDFFTYLADAALIPNPWEERNKMALRPFPRAWPGIWQAKKPSFEMLNSPNIGSEPTSSDAQSPASDEDGQLTIEAQKTCVQGLPWFRFLLAAMGVAIAIWLLLEEVDLFRSRYPLRDHAQGGIRMSLDVPNPVPTSAAGTATHSSLA